MKTKRRIVVKVGSSSLASPHGGCDPMKMSRLVASLAQLKASGHDVALVSSGAVASGYKPLGYQQRPRSLAARQASAAVGQSLLMQAYAEQFRSYGLPVAQVLLTRDDFSNRERYRHAFQTLSLLLGKQVIPVINENDTVSVAELTFGDNDMLGALVAGLIHADLYIVLTDTNGLYDKDPRKHRDARPIPHLETVTAEVTSLAGSPSALGTGGMRSKLLAAETALRLGIPCYIGKLSSDRDLLQIVSGAGSGTYVGRYGIHLRRQCVPVRKQWIALHSPASGTIRVDSGAAEAILARQRSLLIAGVREVLGSFSRGDVVEVQCGRQLIGRGISKYDANELRSLLQTNRQPHRSRIVIHRDHWAAVPIGT